jgi:hypothetical protein
VPKKRLKPRRKQSKQERIIMNEIKQHLIISKNKISEMAYLLIAE